MYYFFVTRIHESYFSSLLTFKISNQSCLEIILLYLDEVLSRLFLSQSRGWKTYHPSVAYIASLAISGLIWCSTACIIWFLNEKAWVEWLHRSTKRATLHLKVYYVQPNVKRKREREWVTKHKAYTVEKDVSLERTSVTKMSPHIHWLPVPTGVANKLSKWMASFSYSSSVLSDSCLHNASCLLYLPIVW